MAHVTDELGAFDAHLSSYQSLKAGLKVVDAAVVELGHLVQQLLVLRFKVFSDGLQLFPGLKAKHTHNAAMNKTKTTAYSRMTCQILKHAVLVCPWNNNKKIVWGQDIFKGVEVGKSNVDDAIPNQHSGREGKAIYKCWPLLGYDLLSIYDTGRV